MRIEELEGKNRTDDPNANDGYTSYMMAQSKDSKVIFRSRASARASRRSRDKVETPAEKHPLGYFSLERRP